MEKDENMSIVPPYISVILPIYNVEDYIEESLSSLEKQHGNNIEFICVDDGSTDRSGEICEKYANRDHRFKVIHVSNGGVGFARNIGVQAATGEYLAWVDPDDYVLDNWSDTIIKSLKQYEPDVLFFDYKTLFKERFSSINYGMDSRYIDSMDFLQDLVADIKVQSQLWQKVIRRNMFFDISFPENVACMEDYAILHKVILKAKTIYYLKKALYIYRIRDNSLVTRVDVKKSYDCYKIAKQRYDYLCSKNFTVTRVGYCTQAMGVCMQYYKVSFKNKIQYKDLYWECKEVLSENLWDLLSSKISLRNKLKIVCIFVGLMNFVVKAKGLLERQG